MIAFPLRRGFSLALALLFMVGSARSAFGLHDCLHAFHSAGEMGGAAGGEGANGATQLHDHAHHHPHPPAHDHPPEEGVLEIEGEGHPHSPGSHHGPCDCFGECACACAPTLSSGAVTPVPGLTPDHLAARDGTGRVGPRYSPWELPPSTAPPLPLRA